MVLGVISGAHGIKGAFKLRAFTGSPEALLDYDLHDASGRAFKLKRIGEAKGQLICTLPDMRYRDEAEKLKGTQLGVARSALPAPDPDEFYIEDLVGMSAMLEDGSPYGTIKAVHNFGAGDILEISTDHGDEMLSFDEQTVLEIGDVSITICLPEILPAKN